MTRLLSDNQSTLFSHYRIESNANNEIFLEVNLEHLIKVVRSAESAGKAHNEACTVANDQVVVSVLPFTRRTVTGEFMRER